MLDLKDCKRRVYDGKRCVRFEVEFNVGNNKKIVAQFENVRDEYSKEYTTYEWRMRVILDRSRDKDSDVYNFGYILPKDNLPLGLIAATGLKYLQLYLQEEIQLKSEINFTIGEMLVGM